MIGQDNYIMKNILLLKKISIFLLMTVLFISIDRLHAATLYGVVSSPSLNVNSEVRILWYLDTQGKSINVLDGALSFSTTTLKVTDVSLGKSLISLWMSRPKINSNSGIVSFTGGAPGGLKGIVPIFETTLKGMRVGPSLITLIGTSTVLINDGNATEEVLTFPTLQISVG